MPAIHRGLPVHSFVLALHRTAGNAAVARAVRSPPQVASPVLQRFDWLHNKRKVGVEITENPAGGNRLEEQDPQAAWTALVNKAAQWTHTVNLPDPTGAAHTWQVTMAPMNPGFFGSAPAKNKWMKWGNVNLTEDHGDIEWIVDHPAQPMGVSEYRARLNAVSAARAAVRNALTPLGAGPYFLSKTINAAATEVAMLSLGADDQASSQITLEAGDTAATKRGLLEGLTKGLDSDPAVPMSQRAREFRAADPRIVHAVNTAAARLALPGVDTELITAYVIADMCHKAVTAFGGYIPPPAARPPGWRPDWENAAGNFKSWRALFPKSHPSQILLQSLGSRLPTPNDLATIKVALDADMANTVADVLGLIAGSLVAGRVQPLFGWMDPAAASPAHQRIQHTMLHGAYPGGAGLEPDIAAFLDWGKGAANWLGREHGLTVEALTDLTTRQAGVVKSGGFAVHTGASKGFAFEDRAEVGTTFPGLQTTYDRIVSLVDRY